MLGNKELLLNFFNTYLPLVTLIGFILLVLVFGHYLYKTKTKRKSPFLDFISSKALLFGFLATLFGTTMSLIYSEYLGEAPCGLCWLQRVFLYSQLILFTVAYLKNDMKVFGYTIWLSIVGGVIALYHEYVQLGYSELLPCPSVGGIVDCAKPTFLSYGFVTFPFMSLTLFLFLIFLAIVVKRKN
ncbi:disulfide formation protein [bioreactor metagenome]|uniref:Disulfide formation protein n=1 Tax=bioreactor metagenome TaxID=1076179 RepID=A0A644T880_9ZZZZ|nr:disulfide bond formation protein B [Candidatus Elulimicrobiales bacterium]